jgi:HlyD family secretion protein
VRNSKNAKRIVAVVAVALLAFAIWKLFLSRPPIEVDVHTVARGTVEQIVTNSRAGSVRARYRAQIGSETAGRIAAIPLREGASADSGATLMRLADDVARAQVTLASRDVTTARANLVRAESDAEFATIERQRAEGLVERGATTTEALDAARARDKSAAAAVEAARAQVQSAEAAQRLAQETLERHHVRAPFTGVVNALYVELGASVIPGQALLELMSPQDLYVSAPMDELDIGHIRVGLPARVTLDPYPNRAFDAHVTRVAPFVSEFQEQNRTLEVELRLDAVPSDVVLHPGTSADVEIVLGRHDDVARVPALALLEGDHVLVVRDGRLERRAVTPGLRNWDWVEIQSGLDVGDDVVTSLDRTQVEPGKKVRVRRETARP